MINGIYTHFEHEFYSDLENFHPSLWIRLLRGALDTSMNFIQGVRFRLLNHVKFKAFIDTLTI